MKEPGESRQSAWLVVAGRSKVADLLLFQLLEQHNGSSFMFTFTPSSASYLLKCNQEPVHVPITFITLRSIGMGLKHSVTDCSNWITDRNANKEGGTQQPNRPIRLDNMFADTAIT